MKLFFCTGNKHKVEEYRKILAPYGIKVMQRKIALVEIQSEKLEEVAKFKAKCAFEKIKHALFVEDAGLFIRALNGFPGVYSSHALKTLGCEGILKLLRGVRNREAYFKAVIAFADRKGKLRTFTGICRGKISLHARGSRGFGFDPIFIPNGYEKTFAEDIEMKKRVSHRRRAIDKFVKFLRDAHAGKAR